MIALSITWVIDFVITAIVLATSWPSSSPSLLSMPAVMALAVWALTWVVWRIADSPHRKRARLATGLTLCVSIATLLTMAYSVGAIGALLLEIAA